MSSQGEFGNLGEPAVSLLAPPEEQGYRSNSRSARKKWRTGDLAKGVSALERQFGSRARSACGVKSQELSLGHETPEEFNV